MGWLFCVCIGVGVVGLIVVWVVDGFDGFENLFSKRLGRVIRELFMFVWVVVIICLVFFLLI